MCGLTLTLYDTAASSGTRFELAAESLAALRRRGPHSYDRHVAAWPRCGLEAHLAAGVLGTRDGAARPQPVFDTAGNALVYNGDIYAMRNDDDCERAEINMDDTSALFDALAGCQRDEEIVEVMRHVDGKWALAMAHAATGSLWFGRDRLGCRSVLFAAPAASTSNSDAPLLCLSSICCDYDGLPPPQWTELAAGVLCKFDLFTREATYYLLHPNADYGDEMLDRHLPRFGSADRRIVEPRCCAEIRGPCPTNSLMDVSGEVDEKYADYGDDFDRYLEDAHWSPLVDRTIDLLRSSVRKRTAYCLSHPSEPLAILFSGGLDSTLLASLAADSLPQGGHIELVNVAFAQGAPDRQLALSSARLLERLHAGTRWRFVAVDVSQGELAAQRSGRIARLIRPAATVLDDSVGCALWFAARAEGGGYASLSRVALLGSGADELFAGYARHRTRFAQGGYPALREELRLDLGRYWLRNMGRDDRVLADHGRQARMPFLDERFVSFANALPLNCKADLSLARGVGDKLLLRLVAARLRLPPNAPKRAIQFGSRIAKCEAGDRRREKGGETCGRLLL